MPSLRLLSDSRANGIKRPALPIFPYWFNPRASSSPLALKLSINRRVGHLNSSPHFISRPPVVRDRFLAPLQRKRPGLLLGWRRRREGRSGRLGERAEEGDLGAGVFRGEGDGANLIAAFADESDIDRKS